MSNMQRLSDYCNESVRYDHYLNKLTEQIAGTNIQSNDESFNTNNNTADEYSINNMSEPLCSSLWPLAPPFIPFSPYYSTPQPLISSDSKANIWFGNVWDYPPVSEPMYGNTATDFNNNKSYATSSGDYYNGYEPPNGALLPEPIGTNRRADSGQTGLDYSCVSPTDWGYDSTYIQPKIRRRMPSQMECVFCKNNDEPPELYRSHILKDPECKIVCPILRAYDCPICHNGGGDKAHTVRYCPLNRAGIHVKMERLNQLEPDIGYEKRGRGGGSGGGRARNKSYGYGFR